jgi:hypothetical protein
MLGTRDYAPLLSLPAALDFFFRLDCIATATAPTPTATTDNDVTTDDGMTAGGGGGGGIAGRNRSLVLAEAKELSGAWGTELGTPESMVGSTCMVRRRSWWCRWWWWFVTASYVSNLGPHLYDNSATRRASRKNF